MHFKKSPSSRAAAPLAAALGLAAALSSCASPPAVAPVAAARAEAPAPTPEIPPVVSRWRLPAESGPWAAANLPSLSGWKLRNGVPVTLKRDTGNRVLSLRVVWHGTVADPGRAGIEAFALAAMARGGAGHPRAELERLEYARSSTIGWTTSGRDWSSLDLRLPDGRFPELLEAFAACVAAPTFEPAELEAVRGEFLLTWSKARADPYAVATSALRAALYAGHPWAAEPRGDGESIASVTAEEVRDYWARCLRADRMSVVAVGDFDEGELRTRLEAALGGIPRVGAPPEAPVPAWAGPGLELERLDRAGGVAYVRGDFPLPERSNPDFTTLGLALRMLDDSLRDIARAREGACYAAWVKVYGARAPYGSIGVTRTPVPEKVKAWTDEAVAALASGRTAMRLADGSRATVAEALPAYKAGYVDAYFSGQEANADTGSQIAAALAWSGDPAEYLRLADKVAAVGPEDVVACVKAYLASAPIRWIVVGDEAALARVDAAAREARAP